MSNAPGPGQVVYYNDVLGLWFKLMSCCEHWVQVDQPHTCMNLAPSLFNFTPPPIPPMVDTGPLEVATKAAEDAVSLFLNGGNCTKTLHEPASDEAKLVMLKQIRLELPHQSTAISEIEKAILKARGKK